MTKEEQAREAVRRARRNVPWLFTKEGNRQFFSAHMQTADIDLLVDLARDGDREALDILRKHARQWHLDALNAARSVVEVPNSLLQLLLEIFIYGPPKVKRGTSPKDTGLKYQAIAALVKIVSKDYEFPEYTHPEYRGEKDAPLSACRIVAEELGLSERWVEEIWADRKASVMSSRPPN